MGSEVEHEMYNGFVLPDFFFIEGPDLDPTRIFMTPRPTIPV